MKADSPVVTYVYESDDYGGSHNPNIGVLHDVECPLQAGYAKSLIGPNWFAGPATTSTHYIVDPVDICQGVPENRIAWHCGTGNRGTIAIEQAGYARFSRAEWTTPDGLKQRTNVAKLMADINKRRPNIRLKWLSDNELRSAFNNGGPGGWATHDQMRRVRGGTTHYDPMNAPNADHAYPLTELMNEAIAIRGGAPVDNDWFDMASKDEVKAAVREALSEIDLGTIVWSQIIKEYQGGRPAWTLLLDANSNSASAKDALAEFMSDGTNPSSVGYKVWSQIITEAENRPAWVLLAHAAEDEAPKA